MFNHADKNQPITTKQISIYPIFFRKLIPISNAFANYFFSIQVFIRHTVQKFKFKKPTPRRIILVWFGIRKSCFDKRQRTSRWLVFVYSFFNEISKHTFPISICSVQIVILSYQLYHRIYLIIHIVLVVYVILLLLQLHYVGVVNVDESVGLSVRVDVNVFAVCVCNTHSIISKCRRPKPDRRLLCV